MSFYYALILYIQDNKIGSIIPAVELPTTEIIEPEFWSMKVTLEIYYDISGIRSPSLIGIDDMLFNINIRKQYDILYNRYL